jgi:hypothetical protein
MKKQSNSYLPNGGYTLTNGSNYMLDGFQYDTEYNGGVLEKARLPEAKGLSSLPSGILPNDTPRSSVLPSHVDEEGGIHLGDFLKESSFQYVPIVDHSWLAQETQANLEGVRNKKDVYEQMENSFYEDSALKELSEMWDESTNGLGLVPNKNREFVKVVNKYDAPQAQQPGDDYREKIEKAMRRSAYGEPLKVILADLKTDLGNRYTDDIGNRIASDHGLHGNVYIREEAFKGLFNGKWDKQIKARCASAKYIIPASKDCVFDYHQGRKVVSNINWKSAFEHYAPKLKTVGIKLGSGTNYQARLKQAFLSQAPARVQPQTWFAYQEDLTKKYSSEEASEKFANYIPEVVDVGTTRDREIKKTENKVNIVASRLIKSGLANQTEIESILSKDTTSQNKMQMLYRFASTKIVNKESKYAGQNWNIVNQLKTYQNDFKSLEQDLKSRLKQASALPLTGKEKAMLEINQAIEKKIERLASSNYIESSELYTITEKANSPQEKLAKVVSYLESKLVKASTYNLSKFEENSKLSNKTAYDSIQSEQDLNKHIAKENLQNIQSLIGAGILTEKQAYKFASQGKSPQEMYLLVLKEAKNLYAQTVYTANNLLSETNNTFESFDSLNDRQASTHLKAIDNKIAKLVKSNLLTNQEVNSLGQIKDPNKKLAKALGIIEQKVSSQKKDYTDTQYTQHIETKKASVKLASKDTVETWLRQKMAEGAVGNDLDVMLKARFASEVLDHYADSIKSIRTAHEGLSGQVYVDAGAYEKVGCEQGALQHRSNMIPAVLQMDKCATCVFKNAEGTCQKYNKPVIASLSQMGIDNPKKYQKESIRLANASDSEKTASLFVNNYDADEFNLTTNDEIEIETDTSKTPDGLKDVLFGGFEF